MNTRRRNRRFASTVVLAAAIPLASCNVDSGFDLLNTDGTRLTRVDPLFRVNYAIANSGMRTNHIQCESAIVKQFARIFTGPFACGEFNIVNRPTSSGNWNNGYQNVLRELVPVIRELEGNSERSNLYHMARILRAYTFMTLTDSYGDIPYRDAAVGYLEGIAFPRYDSQELVYTSPDGILEELVSATAGLDPTKRTERDALYAGDIVRWQRLGNSLLLRGAMRLSKVSPSTAREYVNVAVSGGLMQSNADNMVILHTTEYTNSVGVSLQSGTQNSYFFYLVDDFVNFLKDRNDPRLGAIAVRYPSATSPADQNEANAVRSIGEQVGVPLGYDNNTIVSVVAELDLPSLYAFSQIDRTRMGNPLAPSFLVTYAQTQLLLAEAAYRGWASGDPFALYESGIRAHMQQISGSYPGTEIHQEDIEAYIAANPLEGGRELEHINSQYWVASFMDFGEAWANFRRSGYPELTPNPLRGELVQEDFIRRFGYPESERSVNPNVVDGTTPDQVDTRFWWDGG